MIRLGFFGTTVSEVAATTASEYTNPGPYQRFVVSATVNVHLAKCNVDQAANNPSFAATQNDFLLLQGEYVEVCLLPGEVLSWIVATGDTNGTIYITPAAQL